MKTSDIINESQKLPEAEREAFVKGALWFAQKLISADQGEPDIIIEDLLPYDSIVVERFKNGSPKVILGPNQGEMTHYEATKAFPKGLWDLPSIQQLKKLWSLDKGIFRHLDEQGEHDLTTCSTGQNGSWTNPLVFGCHNAICSHIFLSSPQDHPTRPIIDLSGNIYD